MMKVIALDMERRVGRGENVSGATTPAVYAELLQIPRDQHNIYVGGAEVAGLEVVERVVEGGGIVDGEAW